MKEKTKKWLKGVVLFGGGYIVGKKITDKVRDQEETLLVKIMHDNIDIASKRYDRVAKESLEMGSKAMDLSIRNTKRGMLLDECRICLKEVHANNEDGVNDLAVDDEVEKLLDKLEKHFNPEA